MATILAAALAAAVAVPLATQPVRATDGQTFLDLVNDRREGAGLSPVDANDVIDRIAVSRANQMAADRALGHDLGYVEERLAANGLCWEQLGEIVAYNSMPASERVGRFVEQWSDLGRPPRHHARWSLHPRRRELDDGEQRVQLRGDGLREAVQRAARTAGDAIHGHRRLAVGGEHHVGHMRTPSWAAARRRGSAPTAP